MALDHLARHGEHLFHAHDGVLRCQSSAHRGEVAYVGKKHLHHLFFAGESFVLLDDLLGGFHADLLAERFSHAPAFQIFRRQRASTNHQGTALAYRSLLQHNAKTATAPSKPASNLELLQALPDTAEEVRNMAKILRADANRDVHLGRRASEQSVKDTDLTNYRVVMFATHGLVAGELPELSQPALALSNPNLTNEKDDGLLTLAEILELKLRADWVVLSACNTASADGQASEAVSGLGRAFFYAGAKALLVSHWPVETVSAKLLTTELFKRQSADAKLTRAQAVREASLAVMEQSAGKSYSYAHPMFWAPFVVVGDGG